MTTTACSFLKRVVTNYPELIGKEIFCSPCGYRYDVTCRLNEDGTISPVLLAPPDDNDDDDDDASAVVERFNTPLELIRALVDANCKSAPASSDLFLSRRRKDSLSTYIQKRQEAQSNSTTIADLRSSTNGDAKRTRKCVGISKLRGAFNVVGYLTSDCKLQIRTDDDDKNNVYRSVHCDGFIHSRSRKARSNCCHQCLRLKSRLESYRHSLQLDRLLCYGLKRRPKYEEVIERRQWDGARKDVSMVVRSGNRLFARQCDGRKEEQSMSGSGFKCTKCWKVCRTLRGMAFHDRTRAAAKMATTSGGTTTSLADATENEEERRIMTTRKAYLAKVDLEKKEKILQRRHADQVKKLRAELKKAQAELTRIAKFVPTHAENRKAVISVVAHLNQETDRIKNPICKWRRTTTTTTTTTTECAHSAESCVALLVHVSDAHLVVVEPSLMTENQVAAEPAEERSSDDYYCRWTNCNRQRPFDTYASLYSHVKEHTGTKDTQVRLEILRNQMINANRPKTGRRHSEAAKHLALAQYRNYCRSSVGKTTTRDAAWQNYSGGFPVITRKTLRAMELKKEAGGGGGGGAAANDGDDDNSSIPQEHNYFQL